ncbi:MAG: internal scaffolding protein [Microvirus sp.]|nr:MAG: internal scaffolding protein [Microvirus sp.]
MRTDCDGVIFVPVIRTPYNYDTDKVSRETSLVSDAVSRTQQQFKDECDINIILERFGVTGHLPLVATQPMSGDFTGVEDYHSAIESVRAANENFLSLPSKVREKFFNKPEFFVDFCLNPANIDAVRELGLAPRPPEPKPSPTELDHGKPKPASGTPGPS